jgi:mono/diheme cytochrome c family protein
MKTSKIAAIILFAISTAVSCDSSKRSRGSEFVIAESKSIEASIFRQNCAVCHGAEGNGKEVSGVMVPSLRYGKAAKTSEEEIYNQIKNGKMPMPAFKNQLSEEDIVKMVRFVMRDLQGRQ